MKVLRIAGGLALAVTMSGLAANAVTLQQAAKPAERPPASYTGDVYVDSRGCAYARAQIGNTVNWVPRLSADRQTVICGLTPTAKVAGMASARPPAPPAPPAPAAIAAPMTQPVETRTALPTTATTAPEPAPAAAPAAISRTISVTCPSDGSKARVRIGGSTVAIQCAAGQVSPARYVVRDAQGARTRLIVNPPERIVVAQAAEPAATSNSRVILGGTTPVPANRSTDGTNPNGGYSFGNGYGLTDYPGVADPVPQPGAVPSGTPAVPNAPGSLPGSGSGNDFGNGYNLAPAPTPSRTVIPEGYRAAWDDGRLNPQRGPRSAAGDVQMAQTLTVDQVPMRTANAVPARGLIVQPGTTTRTVVATKSPAATVAPAKRYVQVGMFDVAGNAQRAAAKLQGLGLPGRVAQTASGKTVVIAGPYDSASAVNAALSAARRGFPDAFLRN